MYRLVLDINSLDNACGDQPLLPKDPETRVNNQIRRPSHCLSRRSFRCVRRLPRRHIRRDPDRTMEFRHDTPKLKSFFSPESCPLSSTVPGPVLRPTRNEIFTPRDGNLGRLDPRRVTSSTHPDAMFLNRFARSMITKITGSESERTNAAPHITKFLATLAAVAAASTSPMSPDSPLGGLLRRSCG